MEGKVVGIIMDENGLEDITQRNPTDFVYKNELGDNVVSTFFEEIAAISSGREFFEAMLKSVTERLLPQGIPVKGFIFTKNSVVVLQEDDCTAFIVDWPGAANVRKVNVSVTTEDPSDEYSDDEDPEEDDSEDQPEDDGGENGESENEDE